MQFKIQKSIDTLNDIRHFMKRNLEAELKDDKLIIEMYVEAYDVIKDIHCDISLFQLILRETEEGNDKEVHSGKLIQDFEQIS